MAGTGSLDEIRKVLDEMLEALPAPRSCGVFMTSS